MGIGILVESYERVNRPVPEFERKRQIIVHLL
jgi:hypothetical protein